MTFQPSTDTINFIFTNALRDLTDAGELFVGGGSVMPYLIYLAQQQQVKITAFESAVAAQATRLNVQQAQIEQLLQRLTAAGIQ